MVDRSAGTRSWSLSPYQVDVRFDAAAAGENGWFGPLEPMTPLAPGSRWPPVGLSVRLQSGDHRPQFRGGHLRDIARSSRWL